MKNNGQVYSLFWKQDKSLACHKKGGVSWENAPEKLRWFCTSQRLKTCGIPRFLQMSHSQMILSGDSLVAFFMTGYGRVLWKLTSEWVEMMSRSPRVSVGASYQNHRPPGLFLREILKGYLILEPQTIFFYGCLVISNHFPCKDLEPSNWNNL